MCVVFTQTVAQLVQALLYQWVLVADCFRSLQSSMPWWNWQSSANLLEYAKNSSTFFLENYVTKKAIMYAKHLGQTFGHRQGSPLWYLAHVFPVLPYPQTWGWRLSLLFLEKGSYWVEVCRWTVVVLSLSCTHWSTFWPPWAMGNLPLGQRYPATSHSCGRQELQALPPYIFHLFLSLLKVYLLSMWYIHFVEKLLFCCAFS